VWLQKKYTRKKSDREIESALASLRQINHECDSRTKNKRETKEKQKNRKTEKKKKKK